MKKLKLPKRFPSSLQERCSRHSVRRPETTLGCWQRQHRHQIFICFYMGASKTYSCEQLLGMDGQRAPRETAQPAGCNQKLSASELSSSTCYFLPPSITEGLCFLHSQKLWDVNQLMLDPGLKPHFFFNHIPDQFFSCSKNIPWCQKSLSWYVAAAAMTIAGCTTDSKQSVFPSTRMKPEFSMKLRDANWAKAEQNCCLLWAPKLQSSQAAQKHC